MGGTLFLVTTMPLQQNHNPHAERSMLVTLALRYPKAAKTKNLHASDMLWFLFEESQSPVTYWWFVGNKGIDSLHIIFPYSLLTRSKANKQTAHSLP